MKIYKLSKEMAFVGVAMALLGLVVSYAGDIVNQKRVVWWPRHAWGMVIGTAVTAALFFFISEYTGLNKWYAKQYVPLL